MHSSRNDGLLMVSSARDAGSTHLSEGSGWTLFDRLAMSLVYLLFSSSGAYMATTLILERW